MVFVNSGYPRFVSAVARQRAVGVRRAGTGTVMWRSLAAHRSWRRSGVLLLSTVLWAASSGAQDQIEDLRRRAEQGDVRAQFDLAVAYEAGRGVPEDCAEAFKCYRMAPDCGHAEAQAVVGEMDREGQWALSASRRNPMICSSEKRLFTSNLLAGVSL
jgi:TPR repeat protein